MRQTRVQRMVVELDTITKEWESACPDDGYVVMPPLRLLLTLTRELEQLNRTDPLQDQARAALKRHGVAAERLLVKPARTVPR